MFPKTFALYEELEKTRGSSEARSRCERSGGTNTVLMNQVGTSHDITLSPQFLVSRRTCAGYQVRFKRSDILLSSIMLRRYIGVRRQLPARLSCHLPVSGDKRYCSAKPPLMVMFKWIFLCQRYKQVNMLMIMSLYKGKP